MTVKTAKWFASGNIAIREIEFTHRGDSVGLHYHNFSHTLYCVSGEVLAEVVSAAGITYKSKTLKPGGMLLVDANHLHNITCLSAQAVAHCIFAHRNPQGEVVQECTGWEEAYTNRSEPPTPEIFAALAHGEDTHGRNFG